MKKLMKYASTSAIMNIKVEYNKKVIEFNLDEELRISEDNLNGEVKGHVRSYAFLAMLHKKLSIALNEKRQELRRLSNSKLSELSKKSEIKVTVAKAQVSGDKSVIFLEREIAQMDELTDYIGVAVNAFSIRKDLLQTLAANTRKEISHT
jgi:hypothetical protein